jgi:hypothetical protein
LTAVSLKKARRRFFARNSHEMGRTLRPPPARPVRIADAKASAANAKSVERELKNHFNSMNYI